MNYQLIAFIDVNGNHCFYFIDRKNFKYIVSQDEISSKLKDFGSPIFHENIQEIQKINAFNNLCLILNKETYALQHNQLIVMKSPENFLQSIIKFNEEQAYKNHMKFINIIKKGQQCGLIDEKSDNLQVYNSKPTEITVEGVCLNLHDIIEKTKEQKEKIDEQQFKQDFADFQYDLFRHLCHQIERLIKDYHIFQPDISFQNIMMTDKGKWKFLSFAKARQTQESQQFEKKFFNQEFTHWQFLKEDSINMTNRYLDFCLKSLGMVVLQMILIVNGLFDSPQVIEQNKIKEYLNKSRDYICLELKDIINDLLLKQSFSEKEDLQKLHVLDKDRDKTKKIYNFLDPPHIKFYKEYLIFFDHNEYEKYEDIENSSLNIVQNQSIYSQELSIEEKQFIFDKFKEFYSYYKQNFENLVQNKSNVDENRSNLFEKRIQNLKIPKVKSIEQYKPEFLFEKSDSTKKKYNERRAQGQIRQDKVTLIIEKQDYKLGQAILEYNERVSNLSVDIPQQALKEDDGIYFDNFLNSFKNSKIIKTFIGNFQELQFNDDQFQKLVECLCTNQSCQTYELLIDNTTFNQDQIQILKNQLKNRQLKISIPQIDNLQECDRDFTINNRQQI